VTTTLDSILNAARERVRTLKGQRAALEAAARAAPTAPAAAAAPAMPPGGAESDRRLATILFADLSGFTSLSEGLDPEDVRALQTDLLDTLRTTLLRYDAFVEKFVGDAVMAVFGAPTAHEDDPERALRAALEMHEGVDALSARWERRLPRPLQLHIGVNTGRVVAGHIGSAEGAAYAVTGDAVNVAARLQSAAGPGQTLVSLNTQGLTRNAFEFESGGALELKGKSRPVDVFRLLGQTAQGRAPVARGLEAHGLRAPLGQVLVVLVGAQAVGMAFDDRRRARILAQEVQQFQHQVTGQTG